MKHFLFIALLIPAFVFADDNIVKTSAIESDFKDEHLEPTPMPQCQFQISQDQGTDLYSSPHTYDAVPKDKSCPTPHLDKDFTVPKNFEQLDSAQLKDLWQKLEFKSVKIDGRMWFGLHFMNVKCANPQVVYWIPASATQSVGSNPACKPVRVIFSH